MMLAAILGFFVKLITVMLLMRFILTQQELNFNPIGKMIAKFTDPVLKINNSPKSITDKFIPLVIFILFTFYSFVFSMSHSGGIYLTIVINGYTQMLGFIVMFFLCCIIFGSITSFSSSFTLYFYRLGNIWVKPARKITNIKSNYVVIPAIMLLLLSFGVILFVIYKISTPMISVNMIIKVIAANYLGIFSTLLEYFKYIMIVRIIMSWISSDPRSIIVQLIYFVTEPVMAPLRRIIPPLGMFDLSPMVAFLAIQFSQSLLDKIIFQLAMVGV